MKPITMAYINLKKCTSHFRFPRMSGFQGLSGFLKVNLDLSFYLTNDTLLLVILEINAIKLIK